MHCPICTSPLSRVALTRHVEKTDQVYRRRQCHACSYRYTTREIHLENINNSKVSINEINCSNKK
jgi:transcriptional regulator NrdR family protein